MQRRVAELEEEVAALKISIASKQSAAISVKKAKPGVKSRIEDETLFKYRDGLIRWLEAYWPWMEPRLRAAKTAVEVGAILEAASEEPYLRREWQKRLLPNPHALRDFLCSERFRKTLPLVTLKKSLHPGKGSFKGAANKLPTRQIANAMAGVPDITWRRSLDRCSVLPSPVTIPMNLELYYREMHALPMPTVQQLHLATSPVPNPIRPVAERADG